LHLPPKEPLFLSVGQLGSLIVFALCAVVWTRMRRDTPPVTRHTAPVTRPASVPEPVPESVAERMDRASTQTEQRASAWSDSDGSDET
jgi:hypothetical protein